VAYNLGVTVDHIVYAVPGLTEGSARVTELFGVEPAYGGQHTGRGSHNALLSLGGGAYIEIIAPDPDQPRPQTPRAFGLDTLKDSKLVTWAVQVRDIERVSAAAREQGYDPGPIVAMNRLRPDGGELRWRATIQLDMPGDGVVPFLIEWDSSEHPSDTAPAGAGLIDLELEHPRPAEVQPMLDAIGVGISVVEAARPSIIATIEAPSGTVVLT
jgi:hypothetical protein